MLRHGGRPTRARASCRGQCAVAGQGFLDARLTGASQDDYVRVQGRGRSSSTGSPDKPQDRLRQTQDTLRGCLTDYRGTGSAHLAREDASCGAFSGPGVLRESPGPRNVALRGRLQRIAPGSADRARIGGSRPRERPWTLDRNERRGYVARRRRGAGDRRLRRRFAEAAQKGRARAQMREGPENG